jgi:hypothetical protein
MEKIPRINTHGLDFLHFSLQFLVFVLVFYILCASSDAGSESFASLLNRGRRSGLEDLAWSMGLRRPRGGLTGHDGRSEKKIALNLIECDCDRALSSIFGLLLRWHVAETSSFARKDVKTTQQSP